MTVRDDLKQNHDAIAAAERELETMQEFAARLERQIAAPVAAQVTLTETIKAVASRLLGGNTDDADDAAHQQAEAALRANERAAVVAREALTELTRKIEAKRQQLTELRKATDGLVAPILDEIAEPLRKKYEAAVDALLEAMAFLHAAQPHLPTMYGGVGRVSPWSNFSAGIPQPSGSQRWSLRPFDDDKYRDFWRDARRRLLGDAFAKVALPK